MRRSLWHPRPLDLERLNASAALLVGAHDFRAFTPTETQHRALRAHGRERALGRRAATASSTFEITADSFLRHMVRMLVGTMLERAPEDFAPLLDGRPRAEAGNDRAAVGPVPRSSVRYA